MLSLESERYQISLHEGRLEAISADSRKLYTPFGIDRFLTLPEELKPKGADSMEAILLWMRGFLAQPHPFLGRPGPVCPFVPILLQKQALYVCVETEVPNQKSIERYGSLTQKLIADRENPSAGLSTVMVLYPTTDMSHICNAQEAHQEQFLSSGLMLGGLHRDIERPGLHNSNLRTRKSPVPLLACHAIFPGDLVFLTGSAFHFQMYQRCIEKGDVPSALLPLYLATLQKYEAAL